jgi:hypothetical protein
MLMQKSLAFVEFEELEEAKLAVEVSNSENIIIRTNRVMYSFTGRDSIT